MYKRILGSDRRLADVREKAVEGAARFAKSLGASLVIITVLLDGTPIRIFPNTARNRSSSMTNV